MFRLANAIPDIIVAKYVQLQINSFLFITENRDDNPTQIQNGGHMRDSLAPVGYAGKMGTAPNICFII